MPCNATSQLTNAPSVPLQVTMPTNNAQWAVFVQRLQAAINATRDAANRQPVNVVPADFAVYNGSTLPALSIIGATSALDTTKHQFGSASLKLTATASTVTVEFSADPILLQPNARWIESVYIQSSRPSIAGTLAIDTPAGSYPVDISGTLLPGTWGRLYGDCDLTADFSTTATMVLTLTGCSAGDTFNLEGWQIEAGTGNLPSPFVNTTVPQTYVDTASNASEALANANAAQMSANQANTQLAQVASDGVLSPAEKPIPIRDYSVVTTEQAGIDAQAVAYLGASSSQQVAYDNAITALTNYLNSLTTPVAWNNKSGNTTIVAATFDSTWNTVYEKRQILLNAIYQQAQSLANAAQSTANTAQTTGTNAQNTANTANTTATTANANTPTVINPNFANGLTNWIAAQGWTSDATPRAVYTGFAGASGTLTLANTNNVPCQPGSQIIAQALLSSNAANGACYAGVEFLDSTGAHLAYAFGNSITGTTGATLSRKVALAPAGSAFARFFLGAANCTTGTYYAQSCLMTVTLSTMDELPDSASRFAAAQAGADKTSLNTAADTTKVNGISSSSISPIAALMPQEAGANKTETRTSALTASLSNQTQDALGDGTTYARMKAASLTGNDFDFAKGGVNKHLGNVPDGGSRYAVINGAGLKAVSSVDANNRAGIDFTQSLHIGKTLANMPDDATSGRYAVSNIDGNRRALIDATQAGHVGAWNLDSRVADGTTYARTSSGALTGGNVDLAKAGVVNKNLANIADGGGRYGVHAVDSNNLALIDFSQAGHVNKTIDNVGDGVTYLRMPGANMDGNRRGLVDFTQAGHVGKVLDNIGDTGSYARTPATSWHPENVPNASFASPAVNGVVPGWGAANATLSIVPASGALALQVHALAAGVAGAYFTPSNACRPGDVVAATVTCNVISGNSSTARVQVQCFDVNGNALTPTGNYDVAVTSAYSTPATATALATMPANAASFRLFAYVSSNAGATFLILNPRVSVNDLRVAGSGSQVGDQRNLRPITVASLRSVLNISPITYTITSGSPNSTVNFSVAAFTLQAGSAAINYNAASHSIAQANGTTATWYLFFVDPEYAGGTQSLTVTTSPTVAAQYDGAVNIGSATVTVASGGGGSSGSGSGGGGWCVCDDMWICAAVRAKDAQPGHVFDCCDLPTRGTETFKRALRSVDYHDESCVRLTTEGGAQLDCGHTTPFDTVDGCVLRAPDMLGEFVLTDHGLQKIVDVEWIGTRRVCYFHFGGISYAAGRDTRPWWLRVLPQWLLPKRLRRNVIRIYSHNAVSKP